MSSDEMLREILRKQEESLDLKGQLVLLNEKMDTLIDTMNTKISPQGMVSVVMTSSPHMPMYLFLLAVLAMALGLGPDMVQMLNPQE